MFQYSRDDCFFRWRIQGTGRRSRNPSKIVNPARGLRAQIFSRVGCRCKVGAEPRVRQREAAKEIASLCSASCSLWPGNLREARRSPLEEMPPCQVKQIHMIALLTPVAEIGE